MVEQPAGADPQGLLADWPDPAAASLGATTARSTVVSVGDTSRVSNIASISKLLVALATLVAVEEGTLDLDEPAGRPDATVRHLLAHAAGYDFDSAAVIAPVGARRIYSNTGFEVLAHHLEARAGIRYADYQREAVIEPLGMAATELVGSPAHGVHSSVDDLLRLARELLAPTLVSAATITQATVPHFPELAGVLPGVGRFDPNPWGLGFELRDNKQPHWTGRANSRDTFGHFGGSGTFLWVDPVAGAACASISGTSYGDWALDAWPPTSDAVLALVQR